MNTLRNYFQYLLLWSLLVMTPGFAYGQSAGTAGMQFLEIGPSSPAFGISEAYTAASLGPSTLYGNPANMAFESRSSLGVDYTLWLVDTRLSHVGGTFVKDDHAFGAGIFNDKINEIQARDGPGPSDGSFSVSYLSVAGAYAQRIGNHLSLGVTGHFLNEQYLVNQASGFAFNFGISTRWLNDRLRFAGTLVNLGEMSKLNNESTQLPTNARLGTAADLIEFTTPGPNDLPVLITLYADFVHPLAESTPDDLSSVTDDTNDPSFNFGTEISFGDVGVLRAGYKTTSVSNFRQDIRKITFGAGFWIESLLFNYTHIPLSSGYQNGHSIGIQYYFD